MPRKNGRLTAAEKAVALAMAETGNKRYAMFASGMTKAGVNFALQRPAVKAEIVREQEKILFNEILPLAVRAHAETLKSPATPAGARVQAIKLAYERTLGQESDEKAKDPHEMTRAEIDRALEATLLRAAALESVKADRARPVVELEADPAGVFD